jgi:hypothetical protein
MAARKKTKKRATATGTRNMLVWVRLPKGATIELKGVRSAELTKVLEKAGLNPDARCFGGDTCIV